MFYKNYKSLSTSFNKLFYTRLGKEQQAFGRFSGHTKGSNN